MKKLLVLAAAIACSIPAFAFTAKQSQAEVNKEVASRIEKRESLETIAGAAKSGGVVVNPIGMALTFYGSYDAVLAALMSAGYGPSEAVNSLVALGGNRSSLVAAAISKGADPTTVTAATAAGATAAAVPTGFAGFTGNTFSASRASTLGGAGKASVSGS
jgi:hypothetical protein